jgi:hypothetical protein
MLDELPREQRAFIIDWIAYNKKRIGPTWSYPFEKNRFPKKTVSIYFLELPCALHNFWILKRVLRK